MILISISCVSANDSYQNELNATDNSDNLEIDAANEKLSNVDEGNFSSLAGEIDSATEGETLELTRNYTYNSTTDSDYTSGIVINKAVTIDGKGFTLSGNGAARIFNVTASNVVLKNIKFANGYLNGTTAYGGAIHWDGDYGNVENCTFSSNTVDNVLAGAIYWQGNNGSINNSTFNGNKAKSGGAISWNGTSGKLTNCIFTDNTATVVTGGAVEWYGDSGYIHNCNFTSNSGNLMGGALYAYETYLNISNCNFNSNKVAIFVGGGAVYFINVSADINNCNFNNNYIFNQMFMYNGKGGALYWACDANYAGKGNIVNCSFSGNKGSTGYSIYANSTLNIYNSTFADNSKVSTIYNTGELFLENNTLNNYNTIMNEGTITSPTTVTTTASPANVTLGDEIIVTGDISDDNNNLIIFPQLTVFIGNNNATATFDSTGTFTATCTASEDGNLTVSVDTSNIPSASVETSNVTVKQKDPIFTTLAYYINSTGEGETLKLTQNYTYNSARDSNYTSGIAINKNITVDGAGFTVNGNGLARIFYVNGSDVVFKNITFINGNADNGGAIYSTSETTITDCYFESNSATKLGGAVYAAGGNITASTFADNTANEGGAVYFTAKANIADSVFTLNSATKNGGAVYFEKRSYITNSNLTDNKANTNNGGALYFKNSGDIINCILVNNSAPANNGGGAFFKDEDKTGTITDSIFINNTADKGAGAYIKGIGIVTGSTFTNNSVTKNGGAAYIIGNATVSSSNFTNNNAGINGGALYLESNGNITDCIFKQNTAVNGTSVYSATTSIADSTFEDGESSCAVYNIGKLSLDNNTFNNNNYAESDSIASITSIVLYDATCYINEEENITGAIYDSNGNIVKFSDIVLTLNGTNLTTSFKEDGSFYFAFKGNASNIGTYIISATGYSTKLTNTTITEATLNVFKLTPAIGIDVNDTTYPNDIVIKITGNAEGNYNYTVGNINGNITISNGTGTITLSKLAIGEYTVAIAFEGNENYSSNSSSESFKIIAPIQSNSNVNMFYLDGSSYKVRVYGADCNVTSGVKVTFTINKVSYIRTTDKNGWATLSLNIKKLVPKSYAVTAAYNGYSVKNTVKVKQIISAKKTTQVKKTAKTLKIKIKLKGKTLLKKKTLKVKFKGKTYKIKTNNKGIATFKLTSKVIKKLKAGKKYTYTITYQKDTLKRFIKVKK